MGNSKYENQHKRYGDCSVPSHSELFKTYKNRIFSIAFRMLGNPQDAEDATQEIFIKIFGNIDRFRGDSALSTWIYRIAMNTTVEFLRKRGRHNKDIPLEDMEHCPELTHETNDTGSFNRIVDSEIQKLPEGYKKIFILYAIEGFKHHEISEILNISEGTSKSQYFRARTQLRKQLLPHLEVLKNEMQ